MIDDLVAQKPDAILVAPNNADALVPVAKKATTSGIKVITYDADVADPTARQWSVSQGTSHWRGQRSSTWWANRLGRAHASLL